MDTGPSFEWMYTRPSSSPATVRHSSTTGSRARRIATGRGDKRAGAKAAYQSRPRIPRSAQLNYSDLAPASVVHRDASLIDERAGASKSSPTLVFADRVGCKHRIWDFTLRMHRPRL